MWNLVLHLLSILEFIICLDFNKIYPPCRCLLFLLWEQCLDGFCCWTTDLDIQERNEPPDVFPGLGGSRLEPWNWSEYIEDESGIIFGLKHVDILFP
ncbi:unnamed protein product [Rhizophagus irregularis]|nr:unnamed protein product [Rhizophagus irregularis]